MFISVRPVRTHHDGPLLRGDRERRGRERRADRHHLAAVDHVLCARPVPARRDVLTRRARPARRFAARGH